MKKIALILCVALLVSCFAGCGKKDDDAETGAGIEDSPSAGNGSDTSNAPSPGSSPDAGSPDVSDSPVATSSPSASPSPSQEPSPSPDTSTSPEASPSQSPSPSESSSPEASPSPSESPSPEPSPSPSESPSPEPSPSPIPSPEPTPSPDTGGSSGLDGSLEDIMQRLYDNLDASVSIPFVANTTLSEDMSFPDSGIVYYIGARGIPFTEGIASEALIGAVAHSVVLLRMASGADIEGAKRQIRDGIDPMKWICNGVMREDVVVESIGNIIMLVLSPDGPAYRSAFGKLAAS